MTILEDNKKKILKKNITKKVNLQKDNDYTA